MHPYEKSISNRPPEQSPPLNKDRFFYFPRAVFIRKFDCIYNFIYDIIYNVIPYMCGILLFLSFHQQAGIFMIFCRVEE